jgi:hypothetical protein
MLKALADLVEAVAIHLHGDVRSSGGRQQHPA